MLLELQNVTKKFDGVVALSDVSFEVGQGEALGLIGPNGWRLCPFNAPPNCLLKAQRQRRVRAPFLKQLVKRLVVIARFVGVHTMSAKAGAMMLPPRASQFNGSETESPRLFQRRDLELRDGIRAPCRFKARVFGRKRGARGMDIINVLIGADRFLAGFRQLARFG